MHCTALVAYMSPFQISNHSFHRMRLAPNYSSDCPVLDSKPPGIL